MQSVQLNNTTMATAMVVKRKAKVILIEGVMKEREEEEKSF